MKKTSLLLLFLMATGVCCSQATLSNSYEVNESTFFPTRNQWYYYDNGVNTDAIGTGGGQFWWGVMFPAGSYQDGQVIKVAAYDYSAMTGTVTIYNDGINAPANAVGSTNVTFTGSNAFVEFTFAAPISINPSKNLWVVFYNQSGTDYPAAVCANTGDANGRWVSLDGTTWEDLATFSLDYTFMVRAYIGNGTQYYSITATAEPSYGGTVTGGGTYPSGSTCNLHATPNSGYSFVKWTKNASGSVNPPSGGSFSVDFESGMPDGWTVVDANNDGWTWCLTSAIHTTWTYYASLTLDWYHGGSNAICSGSFINGVGALHPDEYLITNQVTLGAGSQLSFWVAAADVSYAADHFGVFVSTTGTNPSDFTSVQEWTLTAKKEGVAGGATTREGNGLRLGNWYNYSVDLSAFSGNAYIAFRHFNCYDQYIMCLDDITLNSVKNNKAPWNLMKTFLAAEGGQYGVATDGEYIYTSNWGYASSTHDFYKYDMGGNVVEGYEIPGCGKLRGIAYDGEFFYGVANSSTIYRVDLNNHILVSSFTSTYGAMRCITYDPVRDGFWVVGNWSGNLSLINRNGAVQFVGPQPSSASDVAYYKDDNGVEHILVFTQPAENCLVYDYNISANTYTQIFDFSNHTPGCSGSSGGCFVGQYNGKTAFFGNSQQSPNLVAIYELGEGNGILVSTNPNYSFVVTHDASYVAHFEQGVTNYTISLSASPTNGGMVSGSGPYPQGASCVVHATASNGYSFVKWTENGAQVSTNPNYTFTVAGNRTLVAHFQPQTFTITASASPVTGGTADGGGSYAYGQTCTLTAQANGNYSFVKWTKNGIQVSLNPTYSFTVTENGSYVAHFEQNVIYYKITATADPSNGGTAKGGRIYAQGTTCDLEAIPNSGFSFVNWTRNDMVVSEDPNYSFTVTSDADYVAHFEQNVSNYTITAIADPSGGGDVLGAGTYASGSTCRLTARPNDGWVFDNWTKEGTVVSIDSTYSFVVTSDAIIVAHFRHSMNSYTVTAIAVPASGGSVSGSGPYESGDICTLVATPNSNYTFVNWTDASGTLVTTDTSFSFTVTCNAVYVANFRQNINNYVINATANPTEGGNVSGAGTYQEGVICMLNARPNDGWVFENWTKNETIVSTNLSYSFVVVGDATFTANFLPNNYTITVDANPQVGGSVTGGGSFAPGISCTVTAVANEGFVFSNWSENGVIVSQEADYTFLVDRDRRLTANFSPNPYFIISSSCTSNGSISPQGDIQVLAGTDQSFTIIPDFGCLINKVLVDGADVGPVNSYTFSNVGANHTIHAIFSGWALDEASNVGIHVYPNPVRDYLTVEGEGIVEIQIYDLVGNMVRELKIVKGTVIMNLKNVSHGIYVLVVTFENGKKYYQNIVLTNNI